MNRSRNTRHRFDGNVPIYTTAHEKRRRNILFQERHLSEKIHEAYGLAKDIAHKELHRLQREREALQELKDTATGYQPTAAQIAKAEAKVVRMNDCSDTEEDNPESRVLLTNDWWDLYGNADTDRVSSSPEDQMEVVWASSSSESSSSVFNWVARNHSRKRLLESLFPSSSPSSPLSASAEHLSSEEMGAEGEDQMHIDWASDTSSASETHAIPSDLARKRLLDRLFPSRSPSPAMDQTLEHQPFEAEITEVRPQVSATNSLGGNKDIEVQEKDFVEDIDMESMPVTPSGVDLPAASYKLAHKSGLATPTFCQDFHSQLPTQSAESSMSEPAHIAIVSYPSNGRTTATPPLTLEPSTPNTQAVEYESGGDDIMEEASDIPTAVELPEATCQPLGKSGLAAPSRSCGCGPVPIWSAELKMLQNGIFNNASIGGDVASNIQSAIDPDIWVHASAPKAVQARPECGWDSPISTSAAEPGVSKTSGFGDGGVKDNIDTASVSDTRDAIDLDFILYEPGRVPGLACPRQMWSTLIPPRTGSALFIDVDLIPLTQWYIKAHRPTTGYQGMDGDDRRAWLNDLQRFAKELPRC